MRVTRLVVLMCIISTTAGCANLTARSSTVAEKIDQLVEQQRYGRALQILEKVADDHPDYARLQTVEDEIRKLAASLQQQAIVEGKRLEHQGKWLLARERYEQALKKIPDSKKLRTLQRALLLKQNARVAELEFTLMMARGAWLKDNLVVQQELDRIAPGNWFKDSRYEDALNEARHLARELTQHAAQALKRGDLKRADVVSDLAMALYANPKSEAVRKELIQQQQKLAMQKKTQEERARRTQKAVQHRKQQAIVKSQKDVRQTLRASLQHALDQGQLSEAILIANQLRLQGKLDTEEQQLVQQLALLVNQQIESDMSRGIEHYGEGDYSAAIKRWRNVLELAPDNQQAAERIERATRILEKLQRLRDEKAN